MSVFWGTGIRRKIPAGKIGGELLEAEVSENGIIFYPQHSNLAVTGMSWGCLIEMAKRKSIDPPAKSEHGIRIVEAGKEKP